MKRLLSLFALSGVFAVAAPARADIVYTFASSTVNGDLKTATQRYTSGGYAITASGFKSTLSGSTLSIGTATDLYAKYTKDNPGETGLGIASKKLDPTGDHEITDKSTIEVNMASVLGANPNSSVTFTIGSVQNGEGYAIFGGATSPTTELTSFTNGKNSPTQFSYTISAKDALASGDVFYLTATKHNVLLDTITVSAVPEPATLTLALTGLGFVGGFGWIRRGRSAKA